MADTDTSAPGTSGGAIAAIIGFLIFLALLWAIFRVNERTSDAHGYQREMLGRSDVMAGYQAKQLNDIQTMLNYNTAQQVKWREDELRFGQPYGDHTQRPFVRPFGGPQIVGSNLNASTAIDGSVGNMGQAGFF